MRRRVEFDTQEAVGSAEMRDRAKNMHGGDDMLKVLASFKDVMDDVLSHMSRNTTAIVEMGTAVTNLGIALETGLRGAKRTADDTADKDEQGSIGAGHASNPDQSVRGNLGVGNCVEHTIGPHNAFKIYYKALEAVSVRNPGDGNFFAAKKAWKRLCQEFPVQKGTYRRLLPCVFSESALAIYESVAAEYLDADAEELSRMLEGRLCNASHRRSLHLRFNNMSWREGKESIEEFAIRVRASALALPAKVSDDAMLDRFIQALPSGMKNLALAIPGSFDEVRARVSMMTGPRRRDAFLSWNTGERVNETCEGEYIPGHEQTVVVRDEDRRTHDEDRFANVICYRCGKKGHMAGACPTKGKKPQSPKMDGSRKGAGGASSRVAHQSRRN